MLLIKYKNLDISSFVEKYKDKVKYLIPEKNDEDENWIVEFVSKVKNAISGNDIIFIDFLKELIMAFKALKIEYKVIYPQEIDKTEYEKFKADYDIIKLQAQVTEAYVIKKDETFEQTLQPYFKWIAEEQPKEQLKEEPKSEEPKKEETAIITTVTRKPLTLEDVINDETLEITDADIRDMKATTNKFKMAMILQAKTRLKTVLKLCGVLDKLYDELVSRIDVSLATADTASLMYTAEYISKALNETNQFIMPLINNEKLQNFFIIDNSSVINISDSRVDINKREKIRKAAEIVLDNLDYFAEGQYGNIIDPNTIVEENETNDEAAYRELFEETGISSKDIMLSL